MVFGIPKWSDYNAETSSFYTSNKVLRSLRASIKDDAPANKILFNEQY